MTGVESAVAHADGLSFLSVTEVASLLGVSEEAVRAAVRNGRLPAYRIGPGPKARIRIESSSLAGYLREETVLRRYRTGELPGYRLGSNVLRFRESEIEAWLEGTRPERPLVSIREDV